MDRSEDAVGSARPASATTSVLLSLVIPAYNEGARLGDGVARLRSALVSGAIDPGTTEFVVVDDGSTDDTTAQASVLFSSFPHVRHVRLSKNRGKGAAVRAGVAVARAPIIAFADADMAIDPAQTPQFVRALAGADLAIGSRAASGSSVDRPSLQRSVMNRSFNRMVNALTHVGLDDTQCGFKAFRASAAKLLFHCSVTERFAFDVEILALARRLGLTIAEVPVQWRRVKGSQIRPWTDARSMAIDVYRASRGAILASRVPTLTVKLPSEHAPGDATSPALKALHNALPPGLPVLLRINGEVLVLCPLMSESYREGIAANIGTHCEGATLERASMTVSQLCDMAPLSWVWEDPFAAGTTPAPTAVPTRTEPRG